MTRIRPISAGELPAFASAAGAEHAADQQTYLARLLEQRATRTEWCYLAEDHGRNLGRVALWTLPTLTRPESVILLDSDDDEADALVGLVMPACAPSMGTIGYVGVVPERRGQGYVDDLLSRGTATLLRIDPPVLRADADLDNLPMAAAFARGGWHRIGTRREYELRLLALLEPASPLPCDAAAALRGLDAVVERPG